MAATQTTTISTVKNKKGEVIATVRGNTGNAAYDAQYIGGICPDYLVGNAPTNVVLPIYSESDAFNGRR